MNTLTFIFFLISWRSSPRDSELLRRAWTDDFETLYLIGSTIFHKLFGGSNGSLCKSLFPWIANYNETGRDYVNTKDFRVLCVRLVQTVAIFLDKMSEKDKVEIFLYKLGQRHVDYLPKDMKPEYFDVLREVVHDDFNDRIQSLTRKGELTRDEQDRAIQLWHDTVVYIFDRVQEGFFDGLSGFDRFPGVEKWALVQYPVPSPSSIPPSLRTISRVRP